MTLRLAGLGKVYPGGSHAVKGVDLEVADGELLVLVGPSGSGKSTVLRMVAGLETPSEGSIHIDDRDVTALEPQARDVAMVFQSYALYPHKTVRENLAFGLRMRHLPPTEIKERVDWASRTLDIESLLDRKPAQLSGGQRQRVALGRAIVRRPRVFLLDEPLSNLDPALRLHTRTELARLQRRLGVTTLYVTHDQEEAMTLGERVAVLRDGVVEQLAPPMELYRRPATVFVASFLGSPAMNLVSCRVMGEGDGLHLVGQGVRVRVTGAHADLLKGRGRVVVGVRPQEVRPADEAEEAEFRGVIELVEPRGSDVVARLRPSGQDPEEDVTPGESASSAGPSRRRGHEPASFAVVLPPDTEVHSGETLSLRLPRQGLHFFEPETGQRLGEAPVSA